MYNTFANIFYESKHRFFVAGKKLKYEEDDIRIGSIQTDVLNFGF